MAILDIAIESILVVPRPGGQPMKGGDTMGFPQWVWDMIAEIQDWMHTLVF